MRRATDDTAVARLVLEVFLSTLSLRRATWTTSAAARPPANFYPRSPCGERPSDGAHPFLPGNFYPRSPCGERPDAHPTLTGKDAKFLSTLSLRRATAPAKAATNDGGDFYPRSPCGERPILGNPCAGCPAISIHALLAESDRPGRRSAHRHLPISIHALLAESDGATLSRTLLTALFLSTLSLRRATAGGRSSTRRSIHFYPRSPCGERLLCHFLRFDRHKFLSTLSLRRAT